MRGKMDCGSRMIGKELVPLGLVEDWEQSRLM